MTSFTKACYLGQETSRAWGSAASQTARCAAARRARPSRAPVTRAAARRAAVTSVARTPDLGAIGLAILRRQVAPDDEARREAWPAGRGAPVRPPVSEEGGAGALAGLLGPGRRGAVGGHPGAPRTMDAASASLRVAGWTPQDWAFASSCPRAHATWWCTCRTRSPPRVRDAGAGPDPLTPGDLAAPSRSARRRARRRADARGLGPSDGPPVRVEAVGERR